jgi:hypothetical protein
LAAAPILPSDTVGAAIWEAGARDGSGETVDVLDVVLCVLGAPDCAAAPKPPRSRTVRARANDPGRSRRNRVGTERAEAGVGENFVIGCNMLTLLVRVDRETEIDLRRRAGGYKSPTSKCILVRPACV